jgi:capsule polysaccharide export protein KpsE/RkpR
MSSVKPVPINPGSAGAPTESPSSAMSVLSAVEIARAARARRARRLIRNLVLWVGVPSLLGVLYFGLIAVDQYESFSVLAVPPAQSIMLREYVLSRDMLKKLESGAQFSQKYGGLNDPFEGLPAHAGSEQRYRFFLRKVDVGIEDAGIFRLKVRATTSADAARFAQLMVSELGTFIAAHHADPAAHMVVVSAPSVPTEPTYPQRLYGMVTVLLVSAALYAIGSLLVAAAREHAQF